MINYSYLIYGIIALLAILIVISIIKKAIKLVIFIVIIILGFSAYNIFAKGISPAEEIQGYTTNIEYGKSIADYTAKIKVSVDKIKSIVENKKLDQNSINTIKKENANLHIYEQQVVKLKHTEKLNAFHEKYCGYLKTIVDSANGTEKLADLGDTKNVQGIMDKISINFNELFKLNENN